MNVILVLFQIPEPKVAIPSFSVQNAVLIQFNTRATPNALPQGPTRPTPCPSLVSWLLLLLLLPPPPPPPPPLLLLLLLLLLIFTPGDSTTPRASSFRPQYSAMFPRIAVT